MVEPSSVSWRGNRQMTMVPSWQGIAAQHGIQQPMIPGPEWGRPLLVQSAALIQVCYYKKQKNSVLQFLLFFEK